MIIKKIRLLFTLGVSVLALAPPPSLEALLTSVKAAGMALTGTAYPQDALAGAFNPAGMAEVGNRVDVGGFLVNTNATATISNNLIDPRGNGRFNGAVVHNFYDPDIGLNKEINDHFTIGLMVYNRSHVYTKYHHAFSILGRSHTMLDVTQEIIAPVVTYRLNECHSFGVALNIVVQTLKVRGLENFDNPLFSAYYGEVTNRGRDFSTGAGVTVGWLGHLTDRLTLGVSYQPKICMNRFNKYQGFLAQRGKLDIPHNVNAGLAFKVLPCVNFAFDFQWYNYSGIRSLHNPLRTTRADLIMFPLGSKQGTGFGWRDQYFYRFGLDWQANDWWTFRVGYRHASNLVPSSQTAANLLLDEVATDTVSVGATCVLPYYNNAELSAFYGHGFHKGIRGKDSIPLILGGGNCDLAQSLDAFGISIGWCY